jgi:hypothetical protein
MSVDDEGQIAMQLRPLLNDNGLGSVKIIGLSVSPVPISDED